jgi:hypothetical protein
LLPALKNFVVGTDPFTLAEIEDFPYISFEENKSRYRELENWYDGSKLDETVTDKSGKRTELYPVKINPLKSTVLKHAAVLFGEVVDDGRALVVPKLIPRDGDEQDKTYAAEATEALNMLWYENHGRELQLRNGIQSQIYGGCAFKLTYVPEETWRNIPIRIEIVPAKGFVGIPDASDMYRLARGWAIQTIDPAVAVEFGFYGEDDEMIYLIEKWDRGIYKVNINRELASKAIPGSRDRRDLAGVNKWGFVPMTYIPHIRTKDFYGESVITQLRGLVKEMNLRAADFGDAVSDDAHVQLAARNISGTPKVVEIAKGINVLLLPGSMSVTGKESQPDIFPIKEGVASEAMGKLWDRLLDQYRRDAYIPAVADGEDEGSQRSAMTLAFRMWPLGSHANQERISWTSGLNWFNTMALKMMANQSVAKRMKKFGITIKDEHLRMRMKQDWAPMFPRDREGIINELAIRAAHNIGSIDHLLEIAGDIEDIPGEKDKIVEWLKLLAKIGPPKEDMKSPNDANKKQKSENKSKEK